MEHLGKLLALLSDQCLHTTLRDDRVHTLKVYTSEEECFPAVDAVVVRLLRELLRRIVRYFVAAGFNCAFDDGDVLTAKLSDLFSSQLLRGFLWLYDGLCFRNRSENIGHQHGFTVDFNLLSRIQILLEGLRVRGSYRHR